MAEPRNSEEGKADVSQMERVLTGGSNGGAEKPVAKIGKVDEFGAHTKTDPKEIALVKKIDFYILVRASVDGWKNGAPTNLPEAYSLDHVFPQFPRPKRNDQWQA